MLLWPDVMVHVCNPITGKVKAGGQEFEDNLGYVARNCSETITENQPIKPNLQKQTEKKKKCS
jgi:hypothetical protein